MKSSGADSVFAGASVADSAPLAPLSTLRVGPIARRLVTCTNSEQVVATLRQLDAETRGGHRGSVLVFAGGSNLVISDTCADLTAVRLANDGIAVDGNVVRAQAGAVWDDVVVKAIEHGLGGLECLSGIPGSAGATPVQNVGAYGAEVSDTITRVRVLDRGSGEVRWVPGSELGFGYRTSVFKRSGAGGFEIPSVVVAVEFALDASGRSAPLRYGELAAALNAASASAPTGRWFVTRCWRCGPARAWCSTGRPRHLERRFVLHRSGGRPGVYDRLAATVTGPSALPGSRRRQAGGRLVGRAGGFRKGYPQPGPGGLEGPCRLSTKHALALTNRGGATAEDVMVLARVFAIGFVLCLVSH